MAAAAAAPRWEWEDELLYALPDRGAPKCMRAGCEKREPSEAPSFLVKEAGASFAKCSKCAAKYCGRDCQVADWKKGGQHKAMCGALRDFAERKFDSAQKRDAVLNGVVGRTRMYLYPFFVHHRTKRGEGALYVQSKSTLDDFYFGPPVNQYGEALDRSIHVAFVTADEFDKDLAAEDFELALARAALRRALEASDESSCVALLRFRCGYVAVVTLPIFDLRICRSLAADYEGKPQLQLNIDTI